jgi:hypothetical protein
MRKQVKQVKSYAERSFSFQRPFMIERPRLAFLTWIAYLFKLCVNVWQFMYSVFMKCVALQTSRQRMAVHLLRVYEMRTSSNFVSTYVWRFVSSAGNVMIASFGSFDCFLVQSWVSLLKINVTIIFVYTYLSVCLSRHPDISSIFWKGVYKIVTLTVGALAAWSSGIVSAWRAMGRGIESR